METVLHDGDILHRLNAADAVRWMGEAIDAHHRGELVAPPRLYADFGDGRLVFTTGRLRGSWYGYRSYDSFPVDPGAQVVVVHDEASGRVRAIAVGNELGPRRVGAIGGVAADALAASDAGVVAMIGSGTQAYTQLWALAAVRSLREVRVFSRDESGRAAFVERVSPLLDGAARAVRHARADCESADIVILATSSPTPVIDAEWVGRGAYVTTLGPEQQGRAGQSSASTSPRPRQCWSATRWSRSAPATHRTCWPARPTSTGSSRSGRFELVKWQCLRQRASRCSSPSASPARRRTCSTGWPSASRRNASSRGSTQALVVVACLCDGGRGHCSSEIDCARLCIPE
ncbi:MAG: hypothetical protein ACYDES_15250 [Acidimicrobiales bacterium]